MRAAWAVIAVIDWAVYAIGENAVFGGKSVLAAPADTRLQYWGRYYGIVSPSVASNTRCLPEKTGV